MTTRIEIDEQTLSLLQQAGELQVESSSGVPLIVMTVNTREDLKNHTFDDTDLSPEELNAVAARWLQDPEGWGAPEMGIYDELYGDDTRS